MRKWLLAPLTLISILPFANFISCKNNQEIIHKQGDLKPLQKDIIDSFLSEEQEWEKQKNENHDFWHSQYSLNELFPNFERIEDEGRFRSYKFHELKRIVRFDIPKTEQLIKEKTKEIYEFYNDDDYNRIKIYFKTHSNNLTIVTNTFTFKKDSEINFEEGYIKNVYIEFEFKFPDFDRYYSKTITKKFDIYGFKKEAK